MGCGIRPSRCSPQSSNRHLRASISSCRDSTAPSVKWGSNRQLPLVKASRGPSTHHSVLSSPEPRDLGAFRILAVMMWTLRLRELRWPGQATRPGSGLNPGCETPSLGGNLPRKICGEVQTTRCHTAPARRGKPLAIIVAIVVSMGRN